MNRSMINYLKGAKAFNDFFYLLYDVMCIVMPKAQVSMSGAYGWRSFRLDKYRFLAKNQYYFEVYHNKPNELLCQESFNHKSQYHYFPINKINLSEEGFFGLSREEQQNFLKKFVEDSEYKAIRWQINSQRKEQIPEEFQNGKPVQRHEFAERYSISRIPEEYLEFCPAQDHFFSLLTEAIIKASNTVLNRKVSLIPNASWRNWDFRGYRLKFLDSLDEVPEGPSDYTWRIYYKEPHKLYCEYNKKDKHPIIHPFTMDSKFLTASDEERANALFQYSSLVLSR